jgi:hypothetical protein
MGAVCPSVDHEIRAMVSVGPLQAGESLNDSDWLVALCRRASAPDQQKPQ